MNVKTDNKETDDKEKQEDEKKKVTARSVILEVLVYLVLFFICVYVVPKYVIQRTIVEGPSMENTLYNEDQLIVEKLSVRLDRLKRYDIVVFYPQGDTSKDEYYIKRIIGLPGETVQIMGNTIFINNEPISENFGYTQMDTPGLAQDPIELGTDEYFVLGDNREVSLDSRYPDVGIVKRSYIGGRVLIRIWPIDEFGVVY